MRIKHLVLSFLVCAPLLASAAPSCTKSFNLGSMGPPATQSFTSGFFQAANFSDCYNFSINAAANANGVTTEWSWDFLGLMGKIDVWGAQLFQGATSVGAYDNSPETFSFGNLVAGNYKLVISGQATKGLLGTLVSYSGTLATTAANTSVAAPVPEPALYIMLAMGFGAAAWAARRRKAAVPA